VGVSLAISKDLGGVRWGVFEVSGVGLLASRAFFAREPANEQRPYRQVNCLRDGRASIGNRDPGRVNKPRLIDVGSHGPQRIDRSRLGEG
jgi:hypothetical protein